MVLTRLRLFVALSAVLAAVQAQDYEAVWDTITPSTKLNWTSCYTGAQCARFQVLLDYQDPSAGTAAIALVKIPATVSTKDASYKGPILFNPGGPGASGIDFVNARSASFRQIYGPGYDLIGFDPRGVSRTTPFLRTFTSNAEATTFGIKFSDDPPFNATPDALARTYARFDSYGTLSQKRVGAIAKYCGTPLVARDMRDITAAMGFPKLQYYGISYGTIVGMTYASLFPNNVGRIVVDGVVSLQEYYTTEWSNNLVDLHKVLNEFYGGCASAGPAGCALAEPTAAGVQARVEAIFTSLKTKPIGVDIGNGTLDYGVIDYGTLRILMFSFVGNPFGSGFTAPALAEALVGLEHGNGTLLWGGYPSLAGTRQLQCECDGPTQQTKIGLESEMSIVIACTDGAAVHDTVPQLEAWYERNANLTSYADLWPFRVVCAGWKIRPVHPFTTKPGGKTSFPLLFIGNSADPVSPLVNAQTMSALFPGSAVLIQDGPGHTSLAGTSPCTAQALAAYFQNGTLPAAGTVCPIEESMFGPSKDHSGQHSREITEATRQLARTTRIKPIGLIV